jgi:hypothetical protein
MITVELMLCGCDEEQLRAIQTADAAVFPYLDAQQSSSGTVPLVLACGRAAVCTPFEYAKSKKDEGLAVFVADDFGARSLARVLSRVLRTGADVSGAKATYDMTRSWVCPKVGADLLDSCVEITR